MTCGEEVEPIQFDGLLLEKENLPTRKHCNILDNETNSCQNSEELADYLRHRNVRKTALSLSCFSELKTSPVTSLRLRYPELNIRKRKERKSIGSSHSRPHIFSLVGDKGDESCSPYCQHCHRQKPDASYGTFSRISAETSSKGRRLVKKNVTRTILESDISDSDQDCYVVGTSGHELGSVSTYHHSDEKTEELTDSSINLSPKEFNLPNDSVIDAINSQNNLHGDTMDAGQSNQTTGQPASTEPSCAICWTDFSISRGILPCGHRYCYPCIQNWSNQLASKGKVSTCPLCKEDFSSILKVDDVVASDQKVYSETIPCVPLMKNISILADHGYSSNRTQLLTGQTCSVCHSREPEESLESCHVCQIRYIHLYCLDPPLLPWVCVHCRDLQILFRRG
uniref:RING-type domain-containing protein n=1 Tax=Kalanchoe fedtschenkoi TaxID=63787 RepID=A0A7N0ZWC2_KALFE